MGNKNERPEAGKGSTERRVPPAGWGGSRRNGNGAGDVAFAVDPSESGPPPQLTADELALQDRLAQAVGEQCDFLIRVAPAETKGTDASLVIESLRKLDEAVIRQPPIAAQRALAVARDPSSSAAHLASVFEQDPALTRALLQAANSSYYRRSQNPCLSIPEAVQCIGFGGVESIVTTAMTEGVLCRPGNVYAPLLADVWSHMTRTAPIARAIAPGFNVAPDPAFTVGLLHDMGKLIIFDHLSQLRTRQRREINVPDRFLLNMLNWIHEPLGGVAALRWNLGIPTARAIASHHHQPAPEVADSLTELLCVCEAIAGASRHAKPLALDRLWRQAGLTTSIEAVRALLVELPGLTLAE